MKQSECACTKNTGAKQPENIGANRRLTRLDYYLGVALLGGVLFLSTGGLRHAQAGPATPHVISAREFDVVDAAGHVEAKLRSRTAADSSALIVYDDQGTKRVGIVMHPGKGASVDLFGPNGMTRMTLAAADGSDAATGIIMSQDGSPRLSVATGSGQGNIIFTHPDGTTKVINSQ